MTDHTDIGRHTPTPAFRDSLEAQIVRAMRAPLAGDAPPSTRIRRRPGVRTVALIALGMLLGVGTQLASAQVQGARQRSELERAKMVEIEVAAMRLNLARATEHRAREAFATGAGSREALVSAAAEVRAMEIAAARVNLDLMEIRATAEPPRDELWAPVRGDRDFVKERLQMTALVAQKALVEAEARSAEVDRSVRAGAATSPARQEAELQVARLRTEFEILAERLRLREQFVKEKLSAEDVARRSQRTELTLGLRDAEQRALLAGSRLEQVKSMRESGTAMQIDVVRAELALLETRAEMERLRAQLAELNRAKPVPVRCGTTDC